MPRFPSWDGTELAYRMDGSGPPLVCIPGGPGQAVEYLGDLGGLDRHRTLILLDNRGTGESQVPQDPATYEQAVSALYADAATPQELEHYRWLAAPLLYGRWDVSSRARAAAEPGQFAQPATDGFYAGFDADPALPERLAALALPVLLMAGEYDIWPAAASVRELAVRLRSAELALLPRTGHFSWVDDPASFVAVVQEFLRADELVVPDA